MVSSGINKEVRKLDSTNINLTVGSVESLWIYPIKGMAGIEVKSSDFNNLGFTFDRRWMLVDEKGVFISQREFGKMTRFRTKLESHHLQVTNPRGNSLQIPMSAARRFDRNVRVWGSSCRADSYGKEIDEFFSEALEKKCHLVKIAKDFKRTIAPYYSVNPGDSVSFADGFPFLITTTASLEDLSSRVGAEIPMDRFRSNIIIRNEVPFDEDSWRTLSIGSHIFQLVKPCARCVVTTIDQSTGESPDGEPLKTLSKFRTTKRAGKSKVLFGQNAIAEDQEGRISINDEVMLLKTRRRPSFG
jgi:uncharacterized protein YcbX